MERRKDMVETEQTSSPRRIAPFSAAAVVVVASVLLLLIMFHATTPLSAGPLGILIVFTVIYALCTALFFMAVRATVTVLRRFGRANRFSGRKAYYVASVLGFVPVLYLTLSSMGGVTVWGVSLILVFVGLSLFYVLRRLQ